MSVQNLIIIWRLIFKHGGKFIFYLSYDKVFVNDGGIGAIVSLRFISMYDRLNKRFVHP